LKNERQAKLAEFEDLLELNCEDSQHLNTHWTLLQKILDQASQNLGEALSWRSTYEAKNRQFDENLTFVESRYREILHLVESSGDEKLQKLTVRFS